MGCKVCGSLQQLILYQTTDMSYLGDTLTVGLILVLVFGSIALYLYTRVQQTEQKVSLLESIVLDLKLTGEIPSFSAPDFAPAPAPAPAPASASASGSGSASGSASGSPLLRSTPQEYILQGPLPVVHEEMSEYKPFEEAPLDHLEEPLGQEQDNQEQQENQEHPDERLEPIAIHPLSSYDGMALKELQSEARRRGLPVEKGAKKQALLELLKRADAEAKQPPTSSSTSLEPFPHDEE